MQPPLPPLFQNLTALSPELHMGLGLRAAPVPAKQLPTAHTLPLTTAEFAEALLHYPIVFSPDAQAYPMAVLSLDAGQNHFVDAQQQWRADVYQPQYARNYPFLLAAEAGAQRATVLFDAQSDAIVRLEDDDDARPLFSFDGQPAPVLSAITQQLQHYYEAHGQTLLLCQALQKAGLLVDVKADLRLPDGRTHTVQGFRCVNEKAYRALPDATLAQWTRYGWTDAITLHLTSLRRWPTLAA